MNVYHLDLQEHLRRLKLTAKPKSFYDPPLNPTRYRGYVYLLKSINLVFGKIHGAAEATYPMRGATTLLRWVLEPV